MNLTVSQRSPHTCTIRWSNYGDNSDCPYIALSTGTVNRSAQVSGVFSGATVEIQGSNNKEDWHTLKDLQGNDLKFTYSGLKSIQEFPEYIKPRITGGVESDITISLFLQGTA